MNKKLLAAALVCLIAISICVGMTMAYIVSRSNSVTNVFTVGSIDITLTESTGANYLMAPGTQVKKNPTVTVKSGSEDCWLFFKIEEDGDVDTYLEYAIDNGWTPLDNVDGVYYRKVYKSDTSQSFAILQSNIVTVKEDVTKEMLSLLTHMPKLSFTAYAVQSQGIDSATLAWQELDR